MQTNQLRRLRESGIPIDMAGPMHAFAMGIGPDTGEWPRSLSQEQWQEEIALMAREESDFWKGRCVPIQLMVELPFWLMIPDCEISLNHADTTLSASIRGRYIAVSDGPMFLQSQYNVVFIGPSEDLEHGKQLPPIFAGMRAPIYRPMRTVVIFRPEAIEDALVALLEPALPTHQNWAQCRRVNRAYSYLQALAYAHIPFLNVLITSYRLTSHDPFSFQVNQWAVPVWFAQYDDKLIRVCLMPYFDRDYYPALRVEGGQEVPFYATSSQAVETARYPDVAPGTMEILDAHDLMYRGHAADAIRSVVTAIELALEGQIKRLLRRKGCTEEEIQTRLEKTRDNFANRVADYEQISGTRIPGPILSVLPYVNGIRLKSELFWVRQLRHRIVHEGLRIESESRGPVIRAIETMTWLFNWLSWEEGKAEERARNYVLFEALRGMGVPMYSIEYHASGVAVLPRFQGNEQVGSADELLRMQYSASIEGNNCDIELFSLMSFAYLNLYAEDAPPRADDKCEHERYHINHNEHRALVFCLESDGLIDTRTIEAVASRFRQSTQEGAHIDSALCIINHEKNRPIAKRKVDGAIPDDVEQLAKECGITLVTATDLLLLVQGIMERRWTHQSVKSLMFIPGRQGNVPPGYHRIGTCVHFYPRCSVIAVELEDGVSAEIGMRLGIRLAARYHEEPIKSLQFQGKSIRAATGPCRVGIKTTLRKSDLVIGHPVFVRLP
jgi:hypothetical protein